MDADRVDGIAGFGRARAPGRLERALWIAVALAFVGDVATTLLGLRLGLVESNPVARGALAAGGLWGMLALKAGAVGVGLACRSLLPRTHAAVVPACLAGPWMAAAAYNLYLLSIVL